jgi:CTP synthase (UTP-ammonia lyase)
VSDRVSIAVLGDHDRGFVTHRELDATLLLLPDWVEAAWVATDSPQAGRLEAVDGVWVASGSPYRDEEAVFAAIGGARELGVPLLATCSGFQYALVEFARAVAGHDRAAHAEIEPEAEAPVVAPLACSLVGERRMVTCVPGTRLAAICGTEPFSGFHWCGYGLADGYEQQLAAAGLVFSAHADDAGVEAAELPDHPFFIGTLFQPQVGSSNGGPLHPLIRAFVDAARTRAGSR